MWAYTYKLDADGYLQAFKARFVTRGDLQYTTEETNATTLAAQVFRTPIATLAMYYYKIRQYDVVAAYSNASLPQPILAYMPDDFQKEGKCLLNLKALHGLSDSYIDSIAKEFGTHMMNIKTPTMPLSITPLYTNSSRATATAREIRRYQQRIGKPNYAAVITRPDIAYGVSKLSKFLQNPSKHYLLAAEHIGVHMMGLVI